MNSRLPAEAGFERIFIQSAASDAGNALTYGWRLAAGYGLAFLYGLFAAGNSDINFWSLNGADNGLHLVSAAAGLAIALWPAYRTAPSRTADRSI
jgi:hypothetical protein